MPPGDARRLALLRLVVRSKERMNDTPKYIKWGCQLPVAILALLVLLVLFHDFLMPSTVWWKLPFSASEVDEYYDDSWNGDFIRVLKAKLPPEDYERFAASLGLTTKYDPIVHSEIYNDLNSCGCNESWWDPPNPSTNSYFTHTKGGENTTILRYDNGYVYFCVSAW